jgi:hypothetical protein
MNDEEDVEWAWGENFVHNFQAPMDDRISSLRFVGLPEDYAADSLTLFSHKFFKAWEYFAVDSEPDLRGWTYGVESAAVTGSSPWTLYE